MASIYRSVRGLQDDGAIGLQKRALLAALFKNNKSLQGYRLSS